MAANSSRSSFWLIGVATLLVVGAGVLGWRLAGVTDSEAQEGASLRPTNVELAAPGGGTIGFGEFEGEIVIVDFWASWCGPCRMGMPIIEEVAGQFKDKGVVFYAVNLREDKSTVEGYLTSTGLDLAVAMDKRGSVAGKYGVGGIPHTVIIGKDGKVRDVHIGFSNALREELTSMLNKLVGE